MINTLERVMALQEQALFVQDSAFSYHMEWALADISRARLQQHLRALLATVEACSATESNGGQVADVNTLVAFGERTWNLLSDHLTVEGLQSFRSIGMSSSRFAPSTQRDLMIWLHGPRHDQNFRLALAINSVLKRDAELRLELTGFRYFDNRDLTGFIDGAANPRENEIRDIACIAEPSENAGGSFVITQKWQYDLDAFNRLSLAEQEQVMGRSKSDGVELAPALMSANSHVMRADRDGNGDAVKIYRRSTSYGTVDENGLYFMAFSSRLPHFNALLARIYAQDRQDIAAKSAGDRLLEYAKPMTGSYWYAPSLAQLQRVVD
jgi:putative iron-dependent peroxidase